MGKGEIFVNLMNLIGSIDGAVTFMPMVLSAKGLMATERVEYTAEEMERLMHLAEENNISVRFVPLPVSKGRLKCVRGEVRIGIRIGMSFDEYVYVLAHEIAHYYLHYDKGDTIASDRHEEYEEQADRAAKMLLAALSVGQKGGAE
ncbi:MAG: ImmA/IrrE family metallo-endopeptidase [Lachnospiraceae bacterium]|nr:ImmA/IrrE family metallo-endopeptidase [Lachnospiraceae bacterium]